MSIQSIITENISSLIEPVLDDLGFELFDIEFLSERGRWVLRIYIDGEGGIRLDDCALVSREIGDLIEVKDIIKHPYVLEVSSPGLNRPLKREKDCEMAIGKKIKVNMLIPLNGRRNFTGYLRNFMGGLLYLETENGLIQIPFQDIKKANLEYEF